MSDDFFGQEEKSKSQGFSLDLKRVLSRAIRFWYVIILSLAFSLSIAVYKNRYTPRVYPVTASILIREIQEMSGAELLYKNALIDPYRNYLNEPYIIRSYPIIEKVVRDLNFHITFYREGFILTSEAYATLPVKAEWCNPNQVKTGQLLFTILDENRYTLERITENKSESNLQSFSFGDSINYFDYKLCIRKIADRPIKSQIGVPFILQIQNPTQVASAYIARLRVDWAATGSGIINLSLTGTNPEKESDFIQALIIAYRDRDLESKNEAATRIIKFIDYQLLEIKDSIRTVEYQLERFGKKGRVKDMSSEAQRLLTKFESFEGQKTELLIRQNYFQYLDTYLTEGDSRLDQVILPSSMGLSDPILSSLLGKMVELQLEMKADIDPERLKNPIVTYNRSIATSRINEIKKDVEEALRSLRSTDKIKMDFIDRQLKLLDTQMELLPASERQLVSVQRNYSLLENLHIFLMQKSSEAKISRAANTSDIIPVNPPMRGGVLSPKPMQNFVIASFMGLAFPLFIFIFFELINRKIQSREDIDKMSSIPFLGGVGHNNSGNNLIVRDRPKSGVAESFRALRSNLNYFTANKVKQVYMVSSSISGEGKTFTTINLATVFALSGKRTLIVGADMRRPKIFEDFKLRNDTGLSTYLSGITPFNQVVQQTSTENLFLVSGGPVPPNPSELLLNERFEVFIKSALAEFDFVIIDTPPLALVTDAFVISKFVDHIIFVMRQNYTPKEFVVSIEEYYRSGKLKSISLLLNDIYKSGLGYGYGQGYAYNYGYGYGLGSKKKNDHGYYED
jgi:capsular exopolysaccharide synthesis family protein